MKPIEEMTIAEAREYLANAKELAELFGQPTEAETATQSFAIGKVCVVRTYSAGVHVGKVEKVCGTHVLLKDAVRLWCWEGAFTLSEVANNGVAKASRIAERVAWVELTQAIEIIPASDAALAKMEPRNGC